ncbi:MAG: class I SAM-dependent methyltransferase [Chloroflexi bacterium]|nr:class I SAM-dependent methyltransferase [Chloroflexota bacterium]
MSWIHQELLSEHPTRILDLGCGPGLYTSRLSSLGHECTGIDYSPASIAYARSQANKEGLSCTYICEDMRRAEYGSDHGLAMLIFGELNVFRPADARSILERACHSLDGDGVLLLEPHTFEGIQAKGENAASWYSAKRGLFCDEPYLCLQENFWDSATHTATTRYLVIDAAGGDVTRYAQSLQAYTDAEYHSLLEGCGFEEATFLPSLTGEGDETESGLFAIVARKRK